ncbi:MAG TPA: amino acid adenylation domain-containing protein [Pseudonocardiaceae bacterium]|nr:amino acid adenylation domain-containing protein [Pseudonocardiaceae bacterium]
MSPDNAPAAQCVHEIFEAQAAATPQALAVASDSGQLTYAELDARADQLAWRLVEAGVRCGALVGIHLERATEMVVAILAALKAGAGYLMLDRAFPAERRRDMVQDAQPVVLVADAAEDVEQLGSSAAFVAIDCGDGPALPHGAAGAQRESVACVMFTSGSTGRPKAVAAPHRAIISTIVGQHYTRFGPDTVWLQCAPISWDAFALELWGPLLSGGACVIHPGSPDPMRMAQLVARYGITTMDLPTVLFHVIMEVQPAVFAPLRDLLTGGEALSPELAAKLVREFPHLRFVNGYGPVESMVFVTTHQVTASSAALPSVPIGRSMAGKHVHILDEKLRPVADGEVGELYCSGEGLAIGYLGQPALTAERFVANPFGPPGGRMYRTGDLVRRHAQAPLEFVGRVNEQVKILGASVDLAEVEQTLQAHPGVGGAVVVSTGDRSDDRRLVAYVTARPDNAAELTEDDLHDYASAKMPNFMVPSRFSIVDSFPRTHNGKLDRTALATRDITTIGQTQPRQQKAVTQ